MTHRHPAHVYRRRRALVGGAAVAVAVSLSTAIGALATPGGVPASAAGGAPVERITVVALPGDTLWAVADRHRGDVPHGRYVDLLVRVNGGATIQAGQTVLLP